MEGDDASGAGSPPAPLYSGASRRDEKSCVSLRHQLFRKINNFRAFHSTRSEVLQLRSARVSPRRAARLGVAVALVILGATACRGGGRIVLPVALDEPAPALHYPADFGSHEAVVRGVATLLASDLRLPVPDHITVYIYSSRAVFERGLISDGRLPEVRAAELSEFAVGVGKRRQLLLHDSGGPPAAREWLRLIAHELTHVAQIELAQGEGRAEQWLAEGMAEWVAFNVLERLNLDTVANRRTMAVAGIRNHAALVAARLDLETLGNPRGFTVRHLREGSLPTYQLAFLMGDYLIERDGFPRVAAYFRSFERRQDRHANFRETFGQSLEQFELEVLGHLKSVVR